MARLLTDAWCDRCVSPGSSRPGHSDFPFLNDCVRGLGELPSDENRSYLIVEVTDDTAAIPFVSRSSEAACSAALRTLDLSERFGCRLFIAGRCDDRSR
jgi:hypothetical protein